MFFCDLEVERDFVLHNVEFLLHLEAAFGKCTQLQHCCSVTFTEIFNIRRKSHLLEKKQEEYPDQNCHANKNKFRFIQS
jgi:hypothetical protein